MGAMFTAKDAQAYADATFDQKLRNIVADAKGETHAYYKVYWDEGRGSMSFRCEMIADGLRARGFKVTEIRDLGSFRFAEVHFSWADDDSDDKV